MSIIGLLPYHATVRTLFLTSYFPVFSMFTVVPASRLWPFYSIRNSQEELPWAALLYPASFLYLETLGYCAKQHTGEHSTEPSFLRIYRWVFSSFTYLYIDTQSILFLILALKKIVMPHVVTVIFERFAMLCSWRTHPTLI